MKQVIKGYYICDHDDAGLWQDESGDLYYNGQATTIFETRKQANTARQLGIARLDLCRKTLDKRVAYNIENSRVKRLVTLKAED